MRRKQEGKLRIVLDFLIMRDVVVEYFMFICCDEGIPGYVVWKIVRKQGDKIQIMKVI